MIMVLKIHIGSPLRQTPTVMCALMYGLEPLGYYVTMLLVICIPTSPVMSHVLICHHLQCHRYYLYSTHIRHTEIYQVVDAKHFTLSFITQESVSHC